MGWNGKTCISASPAESISMDKRFEGMTVSRAVNMVPFRALNLHRTVKEKECTELTPSIPRNADFLNCVICTTK